MKTGTTQFQNSFGTVLFQPKILAAKRFRCFSQSQPVSAVYANCCLWCWQSNFSQQTLGIKCVISFGKGN